MNNQFTVKQLSADNISDVKACQERNFTNCFHVNTWDTFLTFSDSSYVLYLNNSTVIGYVIANHGHISSLAVDEAYRRCGLGKMLLQTLLSSKKILAPILAPVRPSNDVGRAFLKTFGFIERGSVKDYFRNPTEDGLISIYSKHLIDPSNK